MHAFILVHTIARYEINFSWMVLTINFTLKPKKITSFSLLIFLAFVCSTTFGHVAFAAEGTPGCGMFEIREGCELGGWMHLILGDVVIGALLAIFLHTLAHRSNLKLEHNAKTIQKIIELEETKRNRRKDYSVFNLKGLFNNLLHVIGQVNKSTMTFNETMKRETNREQREWKRSIILSEIKGEEARVARIINAIRGNLLAANDVLEPDVVNQVDGICTYLGEIHALESSDGVMTLPKYLVSKRKIRYVIEKLSQYDVESHSFKPRKDDYPDLPHTESVKSSKDSRPIIEETAI